MTSGVLCVASTLLLALALRGQLFSVDKIRGQSESCIYPEEF
jgi:hypothetical protein